MPEDYRVSRRSDQQVREIAYRTKRVFGVERLRPVNIIRCLQSGWVETEQGKKRLVYEVLPDEQMGEDDGHTEFAPDVVTIRVRQSVHDKAVFGEGRARMTLAHELGHAVMHYGATKSRRAGASGAIDLARVNPHESSEHQAKVFAAAFFIHDEAAAQLASSDEIALEFGVSLQAAEICRERLTKQRERAQAAERVERSSQAFRVLNCPKAQQLTYTGDFCSSCGNPTLIPIAAKFLCHTCGSISEQY